MSADRVHCKCLCGGLTGGGDEVLIVGSGLIDYVGGTIRGL